MADNTIKQLYSAGGQSVWQDDISRDMLNSGLLQERIDLGVRGVTSNPTIFQKAIASGAAYDEDIVELLGNNLPSKRSSRPSRSRTSRTLVTSSVRSTTSPMALMGSFRSKSCRVSPATPRARWTTPASSGPPSIART
jgi:hypothetical protein